MKAFLAGSAVAIIIAIVAALILGNLDWSTAATYQSSHESVRL